ncbi:MAG: hypothetical protein H0V47_03540 [Chloroflexia bacterium]|nr:hypothetical protein [Chloroflexia bacterium]
MQKRVLLIDNDPIFAERLRRVLGPGVSLTVVSVTDQVLDMCSAWAPDLIVLHVLLAPGDAFTMLDEICSRQKDARTAVLCLSRGPGSRTCLQRFGGAVFGALKREIDTDELRSTIADALGLTSGTLDPVAS